jgi:putative transcriptional regulator
MIELLQNKNSATKFEILAQLAAAGPNVRQKHIAEKLGVTPQAVSEYMRQLAAEGLIASGGRSDYRVSIKGVNWMLEMLRNLHDYHSLVSKTITNITTCAAIAESNLKRGHAVGLTMKNGLLLATATPEGGARGISMSSVKAGDDVDITGIEGLVQLEPGKVTILQVPSIRQGGSRNASMKKLKSLFKGQPVGAIGIEALVLLRRSGLEPQYLYGVAEAAIEAARCGLSFLVVCTNDAIPGLARRLQEDDVDHEIVDIGLDRG